MVDIILIILLYLCGVVTGLFLYHITINSLGPVDIDDDSEDSNVIYAWDRFQKRK